jgi:hypothetical protein
MRYGIRNFTEDWLFIPPASLSRIDRHEPEGYVIVGATLLVWQQWKIP